jgi:hypothetical protein
VWIGSTLLNDHTVEPTQGFNIMIVGQHKLNAAPVLQLCIQGKLHVILMLYLASAAAYR